MCHWSGSHIHGCSAFLRPLDQIFIQPQEVALTQLFKDVAREHINLGFKASQLRHLLTVRSGSQERNARSLALSASFAAENPVQTKRSSKIGEA
jgi:hypothetical protein